MSDFLKTLSFSVLFISALLPIETVRADEVGAAFSYDPDGRLTTGLYNQSRCLVYAYDLSGNRTSQQTYSESANPPTWGSASWDGFTWTSGAVAPTWGAGIWGCIQWSEN